MTSRECLRLFVVLTVAGAASGCSGDLGTVGDQEDHQWDPGTFTYQQLVRTTQQRLQGKHLVEPAEGSTTVAADTLNTRILTTAQLDFVTVSKEHIGDLDLAADALREERGDFIVTIEVPDGSVLAHASLADENLLTAQQLKDEGVSNAVTHELDLEIPSKLAGTGTRFPAALFACVDTNKNGKCADEIVNRLDEPKAAQNTIFFTGLQGVVQGEGDGRTIQFQAATADEVGGADWIMAEVLQNLPTADGDSPLTITLAVQAGGPVVPELTQLGDDITVKELGEIRWAQEEEIERMRQAAALAKRQAAARAARRKHNRRTSGCFVAGTRIVLADGTTSLVEQVFEGTLVLTADGLRKKVQGSVAGPEKHPIVEIRTEKGHRLRVTRLHPMLTPAGLRMAGELAPGDKLIAADRSEVAITVLRRLPYDGLVYNFTLPGARDDDHLVNAGGLITGDLHLQQKLSMQR